MNQRLILLRREIVLRTFLNSSLDHFGASRMPDEILRAKAAVTEALRNRDARAARGVMRIPFVEPWRITVGLVDWSLPRPGLDSAFHPQVIAPELDFLSVHIYPEKGKVSEAIETLKLFNVGKPVVIEETFPLKCSREEFDEFFRRSRPHAAGWIGFYRGRTPDECRRSKEIPDAFMLG